MTSSNSIKNSLDLTGLKFNRLTAIEKTTRRSGKHVVWKFLCDCGKEHYATATDVKRGQTTSCGCALTDFLVNRMTIHGATRNGVNTPTYSIWSGMRSRCENPAHKHFHRYGGRGIKVCERWRDFANFLADMGEQPEGLSIDRINNDGDYTFLNCRWSTLIEQNTNRSTNVRLEINGVSKCISEWARDAGRSPVTIGKRLKRGLSSEEAVYGPLMRIRKPTSAKA